MSWESVEEKEMTPEREKSEQLARAFREREAIRRQAGIITRFLQSRRPRAVLPPGERGVEMVRLVVAAGYLDSYQPGIYVVMIELKQMLVAIEKNQADKREIQKSIEALMAKLQQGLNALMQMLDQAVKTNQAVAEGA
jgi:hypothetical protein